MQGVKELRSYDNAHQRLDEEEKAEWSEHRELRNDQRLQGMSRGNDNDHQ